MKEDFANQIKKVLIGWSSDIEGLANHRDIVALNFGIQKVYNGYELFLSGHTWFDEHDLWLLEEKWNPTINYCNLGFETVKMERQLVLDVLGTVIKNELIHTGLIQKHIIVTIGLIDCDYKRIN